MKTLTSHYFKADFDHKTGEWISLKALGDAVIPLVRRGPAFDLVIGGKLLFGKKERKVGSFRFFAEGRGGAFIFTVGDLSITYSVELEKTDAVIYQSVLIKAQGSKPKMVDAVLYYLPELAVGSPDDCQVSGRTGKGVPYPQLAGSIKGKASLSLDDKPAKDPALTILNSVLGYALSTKMLTDKTQPALQKSGKSLIAIQPHTLNKALQPGKTIISQGFCLFFGQGDLKTHRAALKQISF